MSSVEYLVAAGDKNGNVFIYQIPKEHPEDLLSSGVVAVKKATERYSVKDLHKVPVKCLEWSKNGMKLFSGDKSGVIVCTEIDYTKVSGGWVIETGIPLENVNPRAIPAREQIHRYFQRGVRNSSTAFPATSRTTAHLLHFPNCDLRKDDPYWPVEVATGGEEGPEVVINLWRDFSEQRPTTAHDYLFATWGKILDGWCTGYRAKDAGI